MSQASPGAGLGWAGLGWALQATCACCDHSLLPMCRHRAQPKHEPSRPAVVGPYGPCDGLFLSLFLPRPISVQCKDEAFPPPVGSHDEATNPKRLRASSVRPSIRPSIQYGSDLLGKGEVPPSPAPRSICEPSDTADTTLPPFAAHITSHRRRRRRRCIPNPRPHWPVCRTPPPAHQHALENHARAQTDRRRRGQFKYTLRPPSTPSPFPPPLPQVSSELQTTTVRGPPTR